MELDRRISNKLLVGGIFAVLIFGLVGSQQAMAGDPNGDPDIDINKCVAFTESEAGNRECRVSEGSARTIITLEDGDTGFFRIEANRITEATVSSVIVQDKLPAGLEFVRTVSVSGNSYDPDTGVWDVGTIGEGSSRTLIIEFEVESGNCGSDLVNTAFLDPASQDGTGDSNDSASATVSVGPGEEQGCGPIVEVHCEEIFHRYSTSGLEFGPDSIIVGGTGERFEILNGFVNECTYTYDNGFSETKSVVISGEFTLSPPGSICGEGDFFETHVSGTLKLTDEDGNELVLNHEADLCRETFLEETPGGTGSVDSGDSTGIFAGTLGTVETHRTITTIRDNTAFGSIWVEFDIINTGGGGLGEPPTIGMNMAGTVLVVTCGVAFDGQCFNITAPYHEEFKLYEMMSGTHTISITMYCSYGVNSCNYAAIGIMPYSESMANTTWKIELYKDFDGNLTTVTTDPEGYLGTVTVTTQIVGDKFWIVSFTVDFKNKNTGPMKFGVQARDSNKAVRNWELNEGVIFIDSDAYPTISAEFEKSLEIDSLCLNEDPTYRYSCVFAENRDLATQLAEETLWQMLNGEYRYK